jgi:hypothetical protein
MTAMTSIRLAVALAVMAPMGVAATAPSPTDAPTLMVIPRDEPVPPAAHVIHLYPAGSSLVTFDEPMAATGHSRWRRLQDPAVVSFGPWQDRVEPGIAAGEATLWLVAFVGPVDPGWRAGLESCGVRWLAPARPFAAVVNADRRQLECITVLPTSTARRAVLGARPLPVAARIAPDLRANPGTTSDVRFFDWHRRRIGHPKQVATGLMNVLQAEPSIAWIEGVTRPQLHSNLAVRAELLDIAPVWDELGFDGTGVIVEHNDSGVDLGHPALPHDIVLATHGLMSWTDTGHGTHTASLAVGRGALPAPTEGGGCDTLFAPRPVVRGAAPGALLITNNLFNGGYGEIPDMMAFAAREGASISTNSWGEIGTASEVTAYNANAAAVDEAIRDALPEEPGRQPLTVLFSAGNTGPGTATVTAPGTSKSAITVGATQNARCGSWVPDLEPGPDTQRVIASSARGPSQGRLKPDLVATGADVVAAASHDPLASRYWDQDWTGPDHDLFTGTSQACALAAGAAAVLVQATRETVDRDPSPAMVKARLVNGAVALPGAWPSTSQGWGRLDLRRAIEGPPNGSLVAFDDDETAALATGESWTTTLEVETDDPELEVTLVWSDVAGEPGSLHPLVNDLDLVVTAPDGTVYRGSTFADGWSTPNPGPNGNDVDPVEVVRIDAPLTGTWSVEVVAVTVPEPPDGLAGQDFVVVASGAVARCQRLDPPSGVTAETAGANQIRIGWQPVPGASAYRIARSVEAGGRPYHTVADVESPATSWTDTDVSSGVAYHYVVAAVSDCPSEPSPEVSVVADGACRLAPTFGGLATVDGATTAACGVNLTWSPAVSPCGESVTYDVHRGSTADFTPFPATLTAPGVTGSTWVDDSLSTGESAWFLVRARGVVSGLEDDNLVHREGSPGGSEAIWLVDDGAASNIPWASPPASEADRTTRRWRRTVDPLPNGGPEWRCDDDDTVVDRVLAMAADIVLPAAPPARLRFRHRWALQERFDGGVVEYSTDGGRHWFDILEGDGQSIPADPERFLEGGYPASMTTVDPSLTLAGRPAWTGLVREWHATEVDLAAFNGSRVRFRWRLACGDRVALGGGWEVDDIRIDSRDPCVRCSPPAPPATMTALPRPDGVELSWARVAGAETYRVHRSDGDGPLIPVLEIEADRNRWLDDQASGGRPASWAVRTLANGCLSELSPVATAVPIGPCNLPPVFAGVAVVEDRREPGCRMSLRWFPAGARCLASAIRYRIYRGSSADFMPTADTLIADGLQGTTFDDDEVAGDHRTWWMVRAVDLASGLEDFNLARLDATPYGPEHVALAANAEADTGIMVPGPGSSADSGTIAWRRVVDAAHDGDGSWFIPDEPQIKDQVLATVAPIDLPAGRSPVLSFWQIIDLEVLYDGGVLEYSTNDGASWHDILAGDGQNVPANPDRFLAGIYDIQLRATGSANPLAGRSAWTGRPGDWYQVRIDLTDFAGSSIRLRWRLGCDQNRSWVGWWLDDVVLSWPTSCVADGSGPPRRGGR